MVMAIFRSTASSMNELTASLSSGTWHRFYVKMHLELLHNPALMEIFSAVDRKKFIPRACLEHPLDVYADAPHYIGFNATVSAPHMAGCICFAKWDVACVSIVANA